MNPGDLFQAIQSFDQQDAKQLFQQLIQQIDTIIDSEGGTILHVAANYNNQQLIKYFMQQYDKAKTQHPDIYTPDRKTKWLNLKDKDGFTCLHYAVFRANVQLAFLFQQHGIDIYAINKQGLNCLHIAAQGDSPFLMIYYLSKGIKIGVQDSNGRTALHWACYSGQENTAFALIAWGAEIDRQEFTFGMTPLHLAVMSGNGRIVKKLLIKGCDRNIKNFSGKLALDLARQYQYKNITQMIVDKQGIQQLFNIKSPFRRLPKITFPFYFLLVLYLTNYILNVSFVIFIHFPQGGILAFVYLVVGLIVAILFVIVAKKKPGFINPNRQQNDYDMLKQYSPSKICYDCMIVKPQRSRHCQICQRCVSVYDHHCPWIANCIGSKNYSQFYTFLILMWIFMIFTIVFEIINIIGIDWQETTALEIIRMVCVCYGLLCGCAFIIPLSYLLFVQTRNCFTNQTTFQRFSYRNKTYSSRRSSATISQSISQTLLRKQSQTIQVSDQGTHKTTIRAEIQTKSSCQNCFLMCCGNAKNVTYQVGKFR